MKRYVDIIEKTTYLLQPDVYRLIDKEAMVSGGLWWGGAWPRVGILYYSGMQDTSVVSLSNSGRLLWLGTKQNFKADMWNAFTVSCGIAACPHSAITYWAMFQLLSV